MHRSNIEINLLMHARAGSEAAGPRVGVSPVNNPPCVLIDCTQVTLLGSILHMNIADPARL